MLYILVLGFFASATSERVLVVTPQSRLPESAGERLSENDSYLEAYRDTLSGIVSDRRSPLGSYDENYNTLGHSSFIEDDVYPELNHDATQLRKPSSHHHHHHHRRPLLASSHGPPISLSPNHHHHHHHYQHPEHVSGHHTLIDVFPPFHFVAAFLHKFGLSKVVKIVAKIAVFAVILKFITGLAIFLVLPAFVPQDKEKEDTDGDEGILKSLGDITDQVWNGIAAREKLEAFDRRDRDQYRIRARNPETHRKPSQHMMHHPDKDKVGDECMEKDKDKCKTENKDKDKDKNECRDMHKNMDKDKCKEKEKENDEHEDEGELDDVDVKLVKKIIKQWKHENFGGPDKSSAISFLRDCVSAVNRILGILLGYLKMKNGNVDVLDGMMLHHFSLYIKGLVKMWPHVVSVWKG